MSSIDLYILGFIINQPMSAYEFAEFAKKYKFQEMIKISTPAIYKNLKKMFKQGYVKSKVVRQGEMPEKAIYSITDKGRAYFLELMNSMASTTYSIHFDFNTFLAHLDNIKKSEALLLLDKLKNTLINKKILLQNYIDNYRDIPLQGRALIKQHYLLNNTLIEWLEDFIKEFTKAK
jgi:DNA-binding PadR family transcriptional regulator